MDLDRLALGAHLERERDALLKRQVKFYGVAILDGDKDFIRDLKDAGHLL